MLSIRNASIKDLPQIRQLAHEIWPVAYGSILSADQLDYMLEGFYSIPSLEKQLIQSGHTFVLALEDHIPVGFASFSAKETRPEVIRLHKIYVLPTRQGKGMGKFLLQYVMRTAQELGGTALQLNVNRYNPALHFYEKSGFTIVGQEDIDIGKGYFMNDYIMEVPIG
jgi:GNAT superfamily N-acetyltransferase